MDGVYDGDMDDDDNVDMSDLDQYSVKNCAIQFVMDNTSRNTKRIINTMVLNVFK
jgi:hypothetical protein